jgi:hypothetical protein
LAAGFASATAGVSPPAAVAGAGAREIVGGGDSKAAVRERAGEKFSKIFTPREIIENGKMLARISGNKNTAIAKLSTFFVQRKKRPERELRAGNGQGARLAMLLFGSIFHFNPSTRITRSITKSRTMVISSQTIRRLFWSCLRIW